MDALEALYTQVLENAGESSKSGYTRWNMTVALRAFHDFLISVHGVASLPSRDLLRLSRSLLPVDSTVITVEEYIQILHGIDHIDRNWGTPLHPDVKRVAKFLVILGFRCGLRRNEALQPKIQDLCSEGLAEFLIRPSKRRTLKTPNATRKLPLSALLTDEELDLLRTWKQDREAQLPTRKEEYLFGIPELNFEFVPEDTVFPLIHQVMREVTQDRNVRFHHLRHSFATWNFLRLLFSDVESIPDLLPHLPQTTQWLQQSREFRRALYGHDCLTRKHTYAVTLLLGHSAPDVSLEHYVHSIDWALAARLQASRLAPPEALVALASGQPSSTVHRWMAQEGGATVPARLYETDFLRSRTRRAARTVPSRPNVCLMGRRKIGFGRRGGSSTVTRRNAFRYWI